MQVNRIQNYNNATAFNAKIVRSDALKKGVNYVAESHLLPEEQIEFFNALNLLHNDKFMKKFSINFLDKGEKTQIVAIDMNNTKTTKESKISGIKGANVVFDIIDFAKKRYGKEMLNSQETPTKLNSLKSWVEEFDIDKAEQFENEYTREIHALLDKNADIYMK